LGDKLLLSFFVGIRTKLYIKIVQFSPNSHTWWGKGGSLLNKLHLSTFNNINFWDTATLWNVVILILSLSREKDLTPNGLRFFACLLMQANAQNDTGKAHVLWGLCFY